MGKCHARVSVGFVLWRHVVSFMNKANNRMAEPVEPKEEAQETPKEEDEEQLATGWADPGVTYEDEASSGGEDAAQAPKRRKVILQCGKCGVSSEDPRECASIELFFLHPSFSGVQPRCKQYRYQEQLRTINVSDDLGSVFYLRNATGFFKGCKMC
jgi:hypothetical protein